MVHFNELRIEGDCLIIEAEIDRDEYFDRVFIDSVIIDNQESFNPNGPSNRPIYYKEIGIENHRKVVTLRISSLDLGLNLSSNMFFVYIVAGGIPSPETPCGYDNSIIMNTVIDLHSFYDKSLGYIKELNKRCETPKGFIDMILRFKSLELSIKSGHYMEAIKIWKEYFIDEYSLMPINRCNCNERIN